MRVAISFLCTDFHVLREHWKIHNSTKTHAGTNVGLGGAEPNKEGTEPFIGGKVIILDWPKMEVLWEMDIDGAGGFSIQDNLLTVNNMRLNFVSQIDMQIKKEANRIHHSFFNCLHSLEKTDKGYLISSSGTDLIIEIDKNGKTLFEWWATDQGYQTLPSGDTRIIKKDLPHDRYIYPTLCQTTHVNSATQKGDLILATLFHQGELIEINKKTLQKKTLLTGLSCPHGVKKYDESFWTISDTKKNRVLLLDENFKIKDEIVAGFDWVQDHCHTHNKTLLIADANHHRVVEFCLATKSIVNEFKFSDEWRIYQVSVI